MSYLRTKIKDEDTIAFLTPSSFPGPVDDGQQAGGSFLIKKKRWRKFRKLIELDDWWSVWIGFSFFGISLAIATIKQFGKLDVLPGEWTTDNPSTMFTGPVALGMPVLVILAFLFAWLQFYFVQAAKPVSKKTPVKNLIIGFGIMEVLAIIIQVISTNNHLVDYGLKEEVWAFIFGLIFGNAFCFVRDDNPLKKCMTPACNSGEFYIKIGLVLLGVDILSFGNLTPRAILISWPMTIIEIILIYTVFTRFFGFENRELLMMMAAGTCVCGASAATSIKESINGKQQDLALVISILTGFTIVQMIAIPYFARAVHLPLKVGAAWMGATIDSTGSVVAAAEIFGGPEAVIIASSVKIVQNSLIGFIAIGAAMYWVTYLVEESDEEAEDFDIQTEKPKVKACSTQRLVMLWDSFPKFILGFLLVSGALTLVGQFGNKEWGAAVMVLVKSVSRWWFTLGFLGIGWSANYKAISNNFEIGKPVLAYVIGQMWDLAFKLGMSYIVFGLDLF